MVINNKGFYKKEYRLSLYEVNLPQAKIPANDNALVSLEMTNNR